MAYGDSHKVMTMEDLRKANSKLEKERDESVSRAEKAEKAQKEAEARANKAETEASKAKTEANKAREDAKDANTARKKAEESCKSAEARAEKAEEALKKAEAKAKRGNSSVGDEKIPWGALSEADQQEAKKHFAELKQLKKKALEAKAEIEGFDDGIF